MSKKSQAMLEAIAGIVTAGIALCFLFDPLVVGRFMGQAIGLIAVGLPVWLVVKALWLEREK